MIFVNAVMSVHHLLSLDEVLSDKGGDEGEGQVGAYQVEARSGVHVVVGEEEVLLEEHGVQGVQDLEKKAKFRAHSYIHKSMTVKKKC